MQISFSYQVSIFAVEAWSFLDVQKNKKFQTYGYQNVSKEVFLLKSTCYENIPSCCRIFLNILVFK